MKFALYIALPVALACFIGGARAQTNMMTLPEFAKKRLELRSTANTVSIRKCRGAVHQFGRPAYRIPRSIWGWNLEHWRNHVRQARNAASACSPWYITAQIRAATIIGRESAGDPWPNCPDPFDGGGYTWTDTVNCENGGNWLDSPGYYRCGLQFDPMWERRFGRLCP